LANDPDAPYFVLEIPEQHLMITGTRLFYRLTSAICAGLQPISRLHSPGFDSRLPREDR